MARNSNTLGALFGLAGISLVLTLLMFDNKGYTVIAVTVDGVNNQNYPFTADLRLKFKNQPSKDQLYDYLQAANSELNPTDSNYRVNTRADVAKELSPVFDYYNDNHNGILAEVDVVNIEYPK